MTQDTASSIIVDQHFCYTCLLFIGRHRYQGPSPLSIILLREAVDHLTLHAKPGTEVDQNFLQTRLKPQRWTKAVLDQVLEQLVEERLLSRQNGRLFEVQSLSESDLNVIKQNCTSPLA